MSDESGRLPRQVTRLSCPISRCPWTYDDAGPELPPGLGHDPAALATAHLMNVEGTVREHLETHPLIDWMREVSRLRDESARKDRDGGLIVACLLRRLGGHAEISDAELAAEDGTLSREPVMNGFRLTVTG